MKRDAAGQPVGHHLQGPHERRTSSSRLPPRSRSRRPSGADRPRPGSCLRPCRSSNVVGEAAEAALLEERAHARLDPARGVAQRSAWRCAALAQVGRPPRSARRTPPRSASIVGVTHARHARDEVADAVAVDRRSRAGPGPRRVSPLGDRDLAHVHVAEARDLQPAGVDDRASAAARPRVEPATPTVLVFQWPTTTLRSMRRRAPDEPELRGRRGRTG